MGFSSGRVSYRRYHISGPNPKRLNDPLIKTLREHAFGNARTAAPDGIETGWIAPTHLFDTRIEIEKVSAGRFLHVAMRLDRTNAPPAVVRSYRRMEEIAALEASGKKSLSKEERHLANEAAEARAQKEARQGAFRRISVHPLLLDLEHRVAYFASLGSTVDEKLRLLFAETFGSSLTPLDSAEVASRLTQETGRHRMYEDAVAFHLVDPPVRDAPKPGRDDDGDRCFLGHEFLTWLWHNVETGDGSILLTPDGRTPLPSDVAVVIDRVLQLDCDFEVSGRDIIYHDGPAGTPEAHAGLRSGKQPRRAGLLLAAGGEEYSLVLDAAKWQISGLGLPESDEPNPQVRLEQRCDHLVRVSAILDALLGAFLKNRFSGEFPKHLGRMRRWAMNGHGNGNGHGKQTASDEPARAGARRELPFEQ